VCNFGILLTWTCEEGLPLFKEEVVEYFPLLLLLLLLLFWRRPQFARPGRLFASGKVMLRKNLWAYMLMKH